MKTTKTLAILVLTLGLTVCSADISRAAPMGTAFTYQGHLYDANHIADGLYDFQFKLHDADSGDSQVGSDVNKPDVDVIDGYFTVELDFGSDPDFFNGNARWLEIGVRPGDMNDPNTYTPLEPRQKVTAAPYAIYAASGPGISVPLELTGSSSDSIIKGTNTGTGCGLYGEGVHWQGRGVYGYATGNYGHGVHGEATNTYGTGVHGESSGVAGLGVKGGSSGDNAIGVRGEASGLEGVGVSGYATGDSGKAVSGIADGASGQAVYGWSSGQFGKGVYGVASGSSGVGVYGHALSGAAAGSFDGNVGIGTESPQAPLHIAGDNNWDLANTEGDFKIGNDTYRLKMGVALGGGGAGSAGIQAHGGTNDLILGSAGVDVLTVNADSGPRVGIGTITPAAALEVVGEGIASHLMLTNMASVGPALRMNALNRDWVIYGTNPAASAGDQKLVFRDYSSAADRMAIDSNGNVGIGTTAPGEKLEVNGHAVAAPIAGKWQCNSTAVGAGYYQWDSQLINTNANYFSWSAAADGITILKAGYYSVSAVLMKAGLSVGSVTYADIRRNGSTIARSYRIANGLYDTHDLTVIEYFAENDVVKCYADGDRYGASIPYTVLSVYRLN